MTMTTLCKQLLTFLRFVILSLSDDINDAWFNKSTTFYNIKQNKVISTMVIRPLDDPT